MDEQSTDRINEKVERIVKERQLGYYRCVMESINNCEGPVSNWKKPAPTEKGYAIVASFCVKHAMEMNCVETGWERLSSDELDKLIGADDD